MFDRRQKINLAGAGHLRRDVRLGHLLCAVRYWDSNPGPMCMFQRVCVGALGIVFLGSRPASGAAHRRHRLRRAHLPAAGAHLGGRGVNVWIQEPTAGHGAFCGAPLDTWWRCFSADRSRRRVMTGGGECGVVRLDAARVSMPGWVLIMAVALGLVGIVNNIVYPARRA
jgi:disulfide bond formation protein DsbB